MWQRQEVQELSRRLIDDGDVAGDASWRGGVPVLLAIGAANALIAFVHFGLAAAGPQLRDGLELTNSGLGVLLASAPAGLMLGTFAWGVLADAIGERRALTAAYVLCAASLLGAALVAELAWVAHDGRGEAASARELASLGALLLAAGATGSAAHSAGGRAIVGAFPARMHARVLAIRHTFIPIGGAIGGLVMPPLLDARGLATAMAAMSAWGLAIAVVLALVVPSGGALRATRRRARAEGRRSRAAPTAATALPAARLASPLRTPRLWLLGGSCSMLALTQLALVSFLTVYLVDEAGYGVAAAGAIFAGTQLVGAAARIAMGDLADRVGDPMRVLGVLATIALALVLAAMVTGPLPISSARVAGLLLAGTLLVTTSWNGVAVAAAARLAPPGRMGATLGMLTTMFATMGVAAPILVGAVLTRASWTPVMAGGAVVLLVAVIGLARLRATGLTHA